LSFIRSKTRRDLYDRKRGQTHYSIVENVRDGGKVCQKVLLYLGPCNTVEGAIAHFREQSFNWSQRALGWQLTGGCGGRFNFEIVPIEKAARKTALRQAKKHEKSARRCELYLSKHATPPTTVMFVCGCSDCKQGRWKREYIGGRTLGVAPARLPELARGLAELPVVPNSGRKSSPQLGTTSGLKGKHR
jgi:hypothetical protein